MAYRGLFMTIAATALTACAAMLPDDRVEVAERDHARCVAAGHTWPSSGYEECRYDLAESRQQRDWRSLRMMEPRRPEQSQLPPPAADPYRPLPRAEFRCRERTDDAGRTWIECGT